MTLVDTQVAGLMLGCTSRHVQHLVARGLLTNRSTRNGWIRLDIDELAAAIDEGRLGHIATTPSVSRLTSPPRSS